MVNVTIYSSTMDPMGIEHHPKSKLHESQKVLCRRRAVSIVSFVAFQPGPAGRAPGAT